MGIGRVVMSENISEDVRSLISEMRGSEINARTDFRFEEANTTRYYSEKLQLILSKNLSTAELFDLKK